MIIDNALSQVANVSSAFLACLFLHAAYSKASDIVRFSGIVDDYELVPSSWSRPLGLALPIAELATAVLLLASGDSRTLGALTAAWLLIVFGGAVAINVWRGRTAISCGCGVASEELSAGKVLTNVVLASIALAIAGAPHTSVSPGQSLAAGASGVLVFCCWGASQQALANHKLIARGARQRGSA